MTSLNKIALERIWPTMDAEVLAFSELKRDEMYPNIRAKQIVPYIEGALAFGRQAGNDYTYDGNLAPLMAQIAASDTKVTFLDEKKQAGGKLIRAQYERKPAIIFIYRPSLKQIERFFLMSGFRIQQADLMALHMCHEWFHHLEETRFGRTDQALPKVVIRKVGPVEFKQPVASTREIAAHAFTQQVMGLSWYPLLLDVLIAESERQVKKGEIREKFRRMKHEFEKATEAEMTVV